MSFDTGPLLFRLPLRLILVLLTLSSAPAISLGAENCASPYEVKPLSADGLRQRYSEPVSCWPAPTIDPSITHWVELGPLPEPRFPEATPYGKEKADLGRVLFFDPRLSASKQIACASCHDPELGWADGRSVAIGHDRQFGRRNTPTILNSSHVEQLFWDGRAPTLEVQALMSLTNPIEMNADIKTVLRELNRSKGYRKLFNDVYGTPKITVDQLTGSIATFVRTIQSRTSPFDRLLKGDARLMSDDQLQGLHLFRTKAGCMNCHHGPLLSDNKFHNIGFHFYGRELEDKGRYNITGQAEDMSAFRTPGLRDTSLTGPWLHNGWANNMMMLLRFYNIGGPRPARRPHQVDDPLFPETSSLLKPLGLTETELQQLEAFMESLSARPVVIDPPVLP